MPVGSAAVGAGVGGVVSPVPEVGARSAALGTYEGGDGSVASPAEVAGASWGAVESVAWAAATGLRAGGPIPLRPSAASAGPATPRVPPPTIEVARVTAIAWSATRRASGRVAQLTALTAAGSLVRLASRYSTVEASSQ